MDTLIVILVFIGGLITLLGAVLNWKGMYRSRRAKGIVSTVGLTGARIIYSLVGLLLMIVAILGFTGYYGG
jgi:hypothetical protein